MLRNDLGELETELKVVSLQENLGKQKFQDEGNKLFKPVTKQVEGTGIETFQESRTTARANVQVAKKRVENMPLVLKLIQRSFDNAIKAMVIGRNTFNE